METAAFAAIGVLAVLLLLFAAAKFGRRPDVFADVVAFEQARKALARDAPADPRTSALVELPSRRSA
ncbi:MAG: hypothetical protein QOH99_308 [Frankiaceae bacterium]|nr:hypothetical protein [Frankiaceae bacterium]